MIKILKPALLILVLSLFQQGICGQNSINMTAYLSEKFLIYTKAVPREEIYIHSDREEYISGEDVWFKIYLIDRQSLKPSPDSKIAYFELLNSANRPVIQKKIWLDGGFGPGQLVLPDTLSTGIYTIRAYTSWMKNFFPLNCFKKEINIYNAFSTKAINGKLNSNHFVKDGISLQSNSGVLNKGLTIKVDNSIEDVLEITVVADEKYRLENNNHFYMFIQTHGIINHVSSVSTMGENTKIIVPRKQLSAGINHITVFNSQAIPVDEKLIYTPDRGNQIPTLRAADSCGVREKLSLNFEFGYGEAGLLNASEISISVAPVTDYQTFMGMTDYMVFGTEFGMLPMTVIKGRKIEEIPPDEMDNLLRNVKSNWIEWNSILGDEVPVFKYPVEKEDHYLSGKLLTRDQKPADPANYVLLSPPGKIPVFQYSETDKEGNFSFRIHIDEKVNDLIIQPDKVTKNLSVNIESAFSDQYLKPDVSFDSVQKVIPKYISIWGANQQVRKIYGITSVGNAVSLNIGTPEIKRFYGQPSTELVMKDFITLPVMQEVFFELVGGASLKDKKSGYEITVKDPVNNLSYDSPPGLFIDGVVVKDPALIATLDPEIVEKIDVIREKYIVGDYMFYGIVNIITKAGNFSNTTLPDYAIRIPYRVLDPVRSFISPDYSSSDMKKNRIPDFRNTLYWNPTVQADINSKATVGFWTSDYISDLKVNIQGITPEGNIFSIRKVIKAKKLIRDT